MKRVGLFITMFVAAFLGLLLAMRVDKLIAERNVNTDQLFKPKTIEEVEPAQFQPNAAPFDFRVAAKKVMPSVVSVDKSEAYRDFWTDRVSIVNSGTGSGVIISKDGLVLTNNHVIQNAVRLNVRLADNRSFPAKLVGADPRTDLAVIKLEGATNLTPVEMGDSSKVEVGQWVMAVGNPLGYNNTVSVGVVSSLNRTLTAGEDSTLLTDTIQTDAAINSGNSGGALTDDRGRLIGINTAIATPSGGSVGIGFAIPVNRAKDVVKELVQYGYVRYGDPGILLASVTMADPRAQQVMEQLSGKTPPKNGVIVRAVRRNGAAALAGIKANDVILEVDGKVMNDPTDLDRIVLGKRTGETMKLKVWSGGTIKDITLKLTEISRV
jgi:S1-C subfamily serine protease